MFNLNPTADSNRRSFLYGLGASLGALALTDLQAAEAKASRTKAVDPLTLQPPLLQPKAKAVIMLFMEGGPSQADTFDPR